MGSEITDAVRATAGRLGISPSDLLTAISFETGGRMSTSLRGGKDNTMLGLIQFDPENQRKYGVRANQSVTDQMGAVESYLRDRGLQPGMGMLDLYSTINAGRPGLYDRSDTANGGTPGTVADKVATQMVGHRARANTMLGDESNPISISPPAQSGSDDDAPSPPTSPSVPPTSETPGGETPDVPTVGAALGKMMAPQQQQNVPPQINIPQPVGLPAAQRLAAIMQRLQVAQNGS